MRRRKPKGEGGGDAEGFELEDSAVGGGYGESEDDGLMGSGFVGGEVGEIAGGGVKERGVGFAEVDADGGPVGFGIAEAVADFE